MLVLYVLYMLKRVAYVHNFGPYLIWHVQWQHEGANCFARTIHWVSSLPAVIFMLISVVQFTTWENWHILTQDLYGITKNTMINLLNPSHAILYVSSTWTYHCYAQTLQYTHAMRKLFSFAPHLNSQWIRAALATSPKRLPKTISQKDSTESVLQGHLHHVGFIVTTFASSFGERSLPWVKTLSVDPIGLSSSIQSRSPDGNSRELAHESINGTKFAIVPGQRWGPKFQYIWNRIVWMPKWNLPCLTKANRECQKYAAHDPDNSLWQPWHERAWVGMRAGDDMTWPLFLDAKPVN